MLAPHEEAYLEINCKSRTGMKPMGPGSGNYQENTASISNQSASQTSKMIGD
ncbi:hypothetical protein HMPREF0578_1842 [Mobiluncus mulieris 28-1]|uniref:Uncharacterized protein n=1 Tax=Mobiluncus mulieris ATCC 35239 TaxID=871571 RepID=E0QT34_9ACTO|nr:hypothetical protein HMPREF0577_1325 [Mobiluncus mulieris ATCC 35243]EEZ90486.1 hypothetical protein HMPREF0578_1842 [Mobiluncus mulieris 28-1]EFM45277.1 hypothetical protein HMPREF0580_1966 [Mobiluncus mulieris ATCC 35239]